VGEGLGLTPVRVNRVMGTDRIRNGVGGVVVVGRWGKGYPELTPRQGHVEWESSLLSSGTRAFWLPPKPNQPPGQRDTTWGADENTKGGRKPNQPHGKKCYMGRWDANIGRGTEPNSPSK